MSHMERTFLMIKPDGIQRGLIGDIISRFEKRGYKLVASKFMAPEKSHFEEHYAEHRGKGFLPDLLARMTSGPVMPMVWEGRDIVVQSRKMLGATRPLQSDVGTIRGDYCLDVGWNLVHGSDSVESAEREINLWFKPEEVTTYTLATDAFVYEL
eukprot:GHVO01065992.1.p1 GENE.GHVO01065992.1~~GHVO01065992.1.p1  ORF type:complete len:154 (+),score=27.37 GHVO01065992.1:569-1030(+)